MQTLEINKEIIMEKDSLILGLSVRETICAVLGVGVIAGGYLLLENSGFGLQGPVGLPLLLVSLSLLSGSIKRVECRLKGILRR